MKVKIENSKIIFDAIELLEELSGEDQIGLIESLSCQDAVIKHIADQIIHGCTDNGYYGATGCSETPHTPLDEAKRFVAEHSGDVAKREIRHLEHLVKLKEESLRKAWEEIHKLRDNKAVYSL